MSNFINQKSSLCPANGRQTVGDGAAHFDNEPSVLAVCQLQGTDDKLYYSTTFSGGPGVSHLGTLSSTTFALSITFSSPYSGVFDVPKAKCPPDRGSSGCVRDSPAPKSPTFATSLSSSPTSISFSKSRYHPSPAYPISAVNHAHSIPGRSEPRNIPCRNHSELATPPLTPDDGSECSSSGGSIGSLHEHDALDFLLTLFPEQGLKALPYAKRVSIAAPNLGADFEGVVLDLPGKAKTLYVDGKRAAAVNLRESIVALLDLADETLDCNALVIALERSSPNLSSLLHSLMYVGGTVVTNPPFKVDPAFVLVGLEI